MIQAVKILLYLITALSVIMTVFHAIYGTKIAITLWNTEADFCKAYYEPSICVSNYSKVNNDPVFKYKTMVSVEACVMLGCIDSDLNPAKSFPIDVMRNRIYEILWLNSQLIFAIIFCCGTILCLKYTDLSRELIHDITIRQFYLGNIIFAIILGLTICIELASFGIFQ